MTGALDPDSIALLVQAACLIEASAPKPGNVTPQHAFADTSYEDFLLSAAAIGPAFRDAAAAGVGATLLRAVEDTRRVVRANTNLGLLLLLAPLARAAGSAGGPLRERVARVLRELTREDARGAFAAIRLAAPGGLGRAEREDVQGEPELTLREAMALAAERDSVAREYATDYELTFGTLAPALRQARAGGRSWSAAALEAFLQTLARVPDTLVLRKQGPEAARAVSAGAARVLGAPAEARPAALEAFDAELRSHGNRRNPGTTADLVAAGLFVALSETLHGGVI
jgi:triphosphoribosyl-dephospho-CoA synthase